MNSFSWCSQGGVALAGTQSRSCRSLVRGDVERVGLIELSSVPESTGGLKLFFCYAHSQAPAQQKEQHKAPCSQAVFSSGLLAAASNQYMPMMGTPVLHFVVPM